jgi:enoyl-CoA hydratase/carnithine racemase
MDIRGVDQDVLDAGGLALDVTGLVATITLNRPETKNAQSPATWQALRPRRARGRRHGRR